MLVSYACWMIFDLKNLLNTVPFWKNTQYVGICGDLLEEESYVPDVRMHACARAHTQNKECL